MEKLNPIKNHERELFMDALRGFAILGIFIANLGGFSFFNGDANIVSPWIVEGGDDIMEFFHAMLIEGKFYSIFSLLFGWGIALQIKRGLANGTDSLKTIKRRLLVMLLLGAIHLLIWPGDIVFFYALLGFVLLAFRKFSDRTLLITAGLLILSPILLYGLKMNYHILNYPTKVLYQTANHLDSKLLGINSEATYIKFVQNAGWYEVGLSNISGFFYRYRYLFFVSRIPKVVGVFLIGYVIGRSDFYKNLKQPEAKPIRAQLNKKIVYWTIALGLLIGLPANFILAYFMSKFGSDYYMLKLNGWYQTVAYSFGVVPLALAYVGMLMLFFQVKIGNRLLMLLAPVGKMAFSNYMMQSLIGNFVFLNAGLGYEGKVGPVYYTLFGLLVFLFQIILSTVWLRYFQYGPVEWVWRSLTYGKQQPMLK